MQAWLTFLCPRVPDLTLDQTFDLCVKTGYPGFVFQGKLYARTPDKPPGYTDTGMVPEMFMSPEILCLMDPERKRIAAKEGQPILLCDPLVALVMAESTGGVPELFCKALYFQREALKNNESSLILPGSPGFIVPPE